MTDVLSALEVDDLAAVRRERDFTRAISAVIDRLLPVLDAIDRARSRHPDAFEAVDAVLHPALVGLGVERVEPIGETFDPDNHDAVVVNDDEVDVGADASGLVVSDVLRPGYRCCSHLLRPAMVRIGRPEG